MFHGWRVAAASFAILFVIVGIVYYSFPVFYAPLIEEFGWSRAQVTAGFAISIIFIGPLFGISAGFLIDRFGPKSILIVGLALAGTAFFGYGWMTALWMYYIFYFFQTAGYVVAGPIPNQVLIANWFDRMRGRAMGLAYVGIGIGGALAPVLAQYMIGRVGWRGAMWAISALLLLVLIPVTLKLVVNRPSDIGLQPDGATSPTLPSPEQAGTRPSQPDNRGPAIGLKQVLRTRAFWLIALGSFLSIGAVGGVIQHFVLFLRDNDFRPEDAAEAASLLLVSSIVGRVVMGWMADRFRKKYVMLLACLFVAGAIPLLYAGDLGVMAYAFAVVFGFGMGADYMLIPLITAECFGLRSLGRIMGVLITTDSVGQAFAPVLVGRLYDLHGNYSWGFAVLATAAFMGALAVSLIKRPVFETGEHGPGSEV